MASEYQPNYGKYRTRGLSVEKLDQLASFVFENNSSGYFGAAVASVKLIVAIAYVVARKIMIDGELLIEKQQYEQSEHERNQDDLDRDDLDVIRK